MPKIDVSKAKEEIKKTKQKLKEHKDFIKDVAKDSIEIIGKAALGLGGVAAICTALTFLENKSCSVPKDKIDSVPERKAKEIRLSYDEMLLSNIDSLTNENMSKRSAIEKAHTITLEEAMRDMPENQNDYTSEDWITIDEARKQECDSKMTIRVKVGKGFSPVKIYREEYRDELSEKIQEGNIELQKEQKTASLNFSASKDRTL